MSEESLNEKIQIALNEIRPFLESDGGNIELVSVVNNVVKVKLLGNCVSCSVNQMTLKNGCLLYTSPSPRDRQKSRMPSSA